MSNPTCSIHLVSYAGDPLRCLQCEPDQVEADFIYKSRLTIEELESAPLDVKEWRAEAFFRHLHVITAQDAARNN